MEISRCYKFSISEFENMLKAYSKTIKQEIAWTVQLQKIKLEGDTPISFNDFARYMVSIEIDDHVVMYNGGSHGYVYMFGHKYKNK